MTIVSALLFACALVASQREPIGSLQSAVDHLFAPWTAKDSPGCAVGVFRNGRMAFAKGYGMASLEHDVPITPESVFYAGSLSKQFTGMAAALAMQQGKLIYTSIPDLLTWDENFYTGRVGGAALVQQLHTRGRFNDGNTFSYAWGLQLGIYRGLPIVDHGGSLGGYRAHLLRFPSQHTSVALLCNASTIAASGLAHRVADVVLGDRFTTPVPSPAEASGRGGGAFQTSPPATIPPGTSLADYAGTYESGEIDAAFTVTVDGLKLLLTREPGAAPVVMQQGSAADQFRASGLTIIFQRDANKKVTGFPVDSGRVRGIAFVRR